MITPKRIAGIALGMGILLLHPAYGLDANAIGEAAGVSAATTPDGVVRVTWGREDVKLTVDETPIRPFAGLTSWAAFQEAPAGAIVMGDTVVFQDEVSPAMDAAFEHGLEVTALHNHFFYDDPPVYFMHIGGQGDATELAQGVKAVWDAVKRVRSEHPQPQSGVAEEAPTVGALTPDPLEEILNLEAKTADGMVKFSAGREGTMGGVSVAGSMGLSTWAAFTGNDEHAVVDGDFIMTAPEVQPVLKALRKGGIHIVALHNHMTGEKPAFYFAHFWGNGPPKALAQVIRDALNAQEAAAN